MRIHLFRQPIFYFAKRLIYPSLNRMGITPNRLDTYNSLWNITTDVTRSGGFVPSLYTTWELRRLLQGRSNVDNFNNIIRNYVNLDNNMIELFNRLSNSSYGDVLPFIRQVNYMLASIIGNVALFFFRGFVATTILGLLTAMFTGLAGTISILWIPSLADIPSFLSFALKIKSFIDNVLSYLPGNWNLPIPQWLSDKLKFNFINSALWILSTPFLKYVFQNFGSLIFDSLFAYHFSDLFNNIRYFYVPIKTILFRSCWYFIDKIIYYDINGNFAGINWKPCIEQCNKLLKYIGVVKETSTHQEILIKKDVMLYRYMIRILIYLFNEFNLFE